MKAESHPIPEQPCPRCGFELVGAFEVKGRDATPEPGTLTLCGNCAALLMFGDGMILERASPEMEARVMGDPEFEHVRRARANLVLFNALRSVRN